MRTQATRRIADRDGVTALDLQSTANDEVAPVRRDWMLHDR